MKKLEITKLSIILYIITSFVIIGGDQFTKYMIDNNLMLGESYDIIDNFFSFTYVHNTGAAWGIMEGKINLFLVVSLIAGVAIIYYFIKSKAYQRIFRYGLVLIFCGMLGNLFDRIVLGYVRDFLSFIIFGYYFPVFNIADMSIVIGVGLLLYDYFREEYGAWKITNSK